MKYRAKWIKLVSMLLPGLTAVACGTNLRDSAATGFYDFVSGTITDGMMAMWPLANILGGVFGGIWTPFTG